MTTPPSTFTDSPARELLLAAYAAPAPYVSAFAPRHLETAGDVPAVDALEPQRKALVSGGATPGALDAVAARLALPAPAYSGGQGVIAAADGTTVARFAAEGPAEPFVHVDGLPYSAPFVEWDQWKVPHLAAAVQQELTEIMVFLPDAEPAVVPVLDPIDAAEQCRLLVEEHHIDLVVIGGVDVAARALSQRLAGTLPISVVISVVDQAEIEESGGFARAIVRHVADRVARATVAVLRDFRFLASHGATVDGVDDVFDALAAGSTGRLIVHDDPTDMRRAWFGSRPTDVGLHPTPLLSNSARLVDVAIWSAIGAGLDVYVIPSTGDGGPADDIGLTHDSLTRAVSPADE